MEASVISCCKEIQDAAIGRQGDVDHLLGFSRPTWNVEQLSQAQPIVTCFREGALLLHDSLRLDTSFRTLETFRKLKCEVMEHPAHSAELAPSDF
jgi:hypothetical protein